MKLPFVIFLSVLILSSCASEESEKVKSIYDDVEISLNDGAKWKVSPEMKPYMLKGFKLMHEFEKSKDKDYIQLAASLDGLKNKFVSSCNMKGDSHEQLHAWLMPYIGLIDDLKEATKQEDQEHIFQQLLSSEEAFNEYFK